MQHEGQGEMEVGKKGTKKSVFQWLYMTLVWNLICHSISTKRIKYLQGRNYIHQFWCYSLTRGIRISIRGGWTMGNVQDTYMLYEKAGDQYIGRLLIDLPVISHVFAASHPQFTCLKSGDEDNTLFTSHQTVLDATVCHTIVTLFPSLSLAAGILPTLQVSLASLCHNHQWMLDDVPEGTECATGIPPHVLMMSKLEGLKQQFNLFLPAINSLVEKQLDDRNIFGTMLANAMKAIIQQELLPVREAMERANTRSLEAVRENVDPEHKETVEGTILSQDHWFCMNRIAKVSSLQHLTV
eukprot:15366627-Ditylum_brightwellii.AAC.2